MARPAARRASPGEDSEVTRALEAAPGEGEGEGDVDAEPLVAPLGEAYGNLDAARNARRPSW